mgnify:CR=1 FL=1
MDKDFIAAALDYHRSPTRGKIAVVPTKGLTNQRDLALAYSPGVAAACDAIVADPADAQEYTSRGNLVAVVTNGTAVLGLGNIGPLAAKPVMEGKGCLFKKFANIDVFDIELAENDPDKLIDMIAASPLLALSLIVVLSRIAWTTSSGDIFLRSRKTFRRFATSSRLARVIRLP